MSSPTQFGPPPQPSGGNPFLKIALITLAVLGVVCGGLCAGGVFVARRAGTALQKGLEEGMKSAQLAPAYLTAMQVATEHPQVIERLGEPVTPVEAIIPFQRQGKGPLQPAGETLQFDVHGPRGNGIVSVVATGAAGEPFQAAKITVTFTSDGTSVDIPLPEEKPEPQSAAQ